jgi:hypothetical protein
MMLVWQASCVAQDLTVVSLVSGGRKYIGQTALTEEIVAGGPRGFYASGKVVVTDARFGRNIWSRIIYKHPVARRAAGYSGFVNIKALSLADERTLIISNDANEDYSLDLLSRTVRRIK